MNPFQFLKDHPYFIEDHKAKNYAGIVCRYYWFALEGNQEIGLLMSSPPEPSYLEWNEGNSPFKKLHETPIWFRQLYCKTNQKMVHRYRLYNLTHHISTNQTDPVDLFYMTVLPTEEISFSMSLLNSDSSFYVRTQETANLMVKTFQKKQIVSKIKKITKSIFRIDVA